MIGYVLGAPGAGKSSLVTPLRTALSGWVVLDWDGFMDAAEALAGTPIRTTPATWDGYDRLVRTVVDAVQPADVVLFTVCTPDELAHWPPGRWWLLDCADEERTRRLARRDDGVTDPAEATADAAGYRELGLPVIDSTGRSPEQVAATLASAMSDGAGGDATSPAGPPASASAADDRPGRGTRD